MIPWLSDQHYNRFPAVDTALREPDGLLCAGGDLRPERLLAAYTQGIFPWYSEGEPILWWSPDPRTVIKPADIHVSRRLSRTLRKLQPRLTIDEDFSAVIRRCAAPRTTQDGTWITGEMIAAYERLYRLGHAHCATAHVGDRLLGGIYGIAVGRVFFGESMFSATTDGSKMALVGLCHALHKAGFVLLDGQVQSAHLTRMGAISIAREEFSAILRENARHEHDAWDKVPVSMPIPMYSPAAIL